MFVMVTHADASSVRSLCSICAEFDRPPVPGLVASHGVITGAPSDSNDTKTSTWYVCPPPAGRLKPAALTFSRDAAATPVTRHTVVPGHALLVNVTLRGRRQVKQKT